MYLVELEDDRVEDFACLCMDGIAVFLEVYKEFEVLLELGIFFVVPFHEVPKHKYRHSEVRYSYDQLLCHREFHVPSGLSKIESNVPPEWSQATHGFRPCEDITLGPLPPSLEE